MERNRNLLAVINYTKTYQNKSNDDWWL
jgi:hypothetical protein